ncbi:MAG: dTDP-4-dehydrorhamnose reductase [Bacillota bacterium]|nr:dTDP-4-dehydrorhamnose reductase [Bacillota bacterium]
MRVLITGAWGQLGQDLMRAYADAQVLGLGSVEMDVTRAEHTRRAIADWRPDLVIHSAAYTNVDGCEADPDRAFRVNALGTRNVALGCQAAGAVMVYLSTDYVFDGRKVGTPYTEYDRPNPLSAYGQSKLAGEEYVRDLLDRFYIVRTSWLHGLHGKNFLRTILTNACQGKELAIVDDQVGSPTFTADLAPAIRKLAETGQYGLYHMTNAGACSWYTLAKQALAIAAERLPELAKKTIRPLTTEQLSRPAPRPAYSVLRNYNLELAGLPRLRSYEEALREFVLALDME